MTVYVKSSPSDDGSVKFYCPVKSENFLFILKFKMKICESRAAPLNSYPVAASSRAGYAIDPPISMSNNINMNPSPSIDGIPVVRHSMEIEPKMSYQEAPTPAMFPNSNSTPNLFVSNPIYDRPLHDGKKKGKQKHDFQFSQEHELKKMKKNTSTFEEEDSSVYIPLELKDSSSRMSSFSNENSMQILVEKEVSPPSKPKQVKSAKQEVQQQRGQSVAAPKQNGNRGGQYEKREIERDLGGGMESVSRPDHRTAATRQPQNQPQPQQAEKKNIFDLGSRLAGFKGNELSKISISIIF